MTHRFQFPEPAVPGFVPVPVTWFAGASASHAALVQHIYQTAWEQTRAVLMPTRFERLYQACTN